MPPLYDYDCHSCKRRRTDIRLVAERHDGPKCDGCGKKMELVISPVAGVVKNPAVSRSSK